MLTTQTKNDHLKRLASVFTKADSILASRDLKVVVTESTISAPAWSDGQTITLNASQIGEMNELELLSTYGLNMHEIAHVLYTPRSGSEIVTWCREEGFLLDFNALEDQKIETLLVARYPSVQSWLIGTVARHLLSHEEAEQYALLRGRKYLPVKIRKEARARFTREFGVEKTDELIEIVDAYLKVIFPRDTEIAKELIKRYNALVGSLPQKPSCPNGHGDRPREDIPSSPSRPLKPQTQERDHDRVSDREDDQPNDPTDGANEDSEEATEDSEGDTSSDQNSDQESDQESDQIGSGDQDFEGEDFDDFEDEEIDGDSESDIDSDLDSDREFEETDDVDHEKKDIEDLSSDSTAGDTNTMSKALNEVMEEVLSDLHDEIESTLDEVYQRRLSGNDSRLVSVNYNSEPAQAYDVARGFGRELERMRIDADPAWERMTSSGRLNALRVARGEDLDTVFDRWEDGRSDATDLEVVLLLDTSGSMNGDTMTDSYHSMWAIKKALDVIGASTTVITFSGNRTGVLYSADERATDEIRNGGCGGGTPVAEALTYATRVFAESTRAVKIMLAITDGAWDDAQESDELVARLREANVLTSLVFLAGNYLRKEITLDMIKNSVLEAYGSHNCEDFHVLASASDLPVVGRSLVTTAIQRRLASR